MIVFALALSLLDPSGPWLASGPTSPGDSAYRHAAAAVRTQVQDAPLLNSVAVAVECAADAEGRVNVCSVLEETHPGLGFGAAAVALMQGSEIEPQGAPVRFVRTIQFTP